MPTNNTTHNAVTYRNSVLLLAVLVACTGCSFGNSKWKFAALRRPEFLGGQPAVPDPEVPSRLVATWTDTVLNRAGHPSQRGFGGRLLFFKQDSQDPVRVDGQLVIYAFDETDRAPHETQPSRRFIFPREQMAKQESPSKLGPSYSVWLPWDEVGGPQKKISLIARFEPEGGAILLGEQSRQLLPGVSPPEQQLAAAPAALQQAAYNAPAPASPASAERALAPSSSAPQERSIIADTSSDEPTSPPAQQPSMASMTVPLPRRLGPAAPRTPRSLREMRTMPTPSIADARPEIQPQSQAPAAAATPPAAPTAQPVDRAQWLRDSVRATHPVRATLSGQPAPGRAR